MIVTLKQFLVIQPIELLRLLEIRGKELFVLETKYHFAQTIVLEAGNFLRQHLHDDLQIEERVTLQTW